jgi:hypothetical protein
MVSDVFSWLADNRTYLHGVVSNSGPAQCTTHECPSLNGVCAATVITSLLHVITAAAAHLLAPGTPQADYVLICKGNCHCAMFALQFVFWFFGTIFGGALGFLAMWHPALATNPYGLVAIAVAAALVVGSLGVTKARVGITLTLMTMSTVILVGIWFSIKSAQLISTGWGCCLS